MHHLLDCDPRYLCREVVHKPDKSNQAYGGQVMEVSWLQFGHGRHGAYQIPLLVWQRAEPKIDSWPQSTQLRTDMC